MWENYFAITVRRFVPSKKNKTKAYVVYVRIKLKWKLNGYGVHKNILRSGMEIMRMILS